MCPIETLTQLLKQKIKTNSFINDLFSVKRKEDSGRMNNTVNSGKMGEPSA